MLLENTQGRLEVQQKHHPHTPHFPSTLFYSLQPYHTRPKNSEY